MTNEQLTAYLQDESYLYSVGYEELKTLVMQYPYSANLRILLLKKSYLDQNKDYDRNLQMSATYTTNRKHLYKTIKKLKSFKLAPQNVILGEDYLELTELSNIERLLADRHIAEAVQTATKQESLAPDWKLEIDDIAFNEAEIIPEEETFDLSNIAQNLDEQSKPIRTEEDEIDSLISSLVSEFHEPISDVHVSSFDESEEDSLVIHDTAKVENTNSLDTEDFDEEPLPISEFSAANETQPIEFSELVNDSLDMSTVSDSLETPPSVFEASSFDFIDDEDDIKDDDDIIVDEQIKKLTETKTIDILEVESKDENFIIEEEIKLLAEKEDFELVQNSQTEIQATDILFPKLQDKEIEEDVKKTDIQLEIINQTKAPIVDSQLTAPVLEKKPTFTEWLSQFRMTAPALAKVTATPPIANVGEKIDNQIVTPLETDDSVRRTSRKSMIELFETENDVPDNLFGIVEKKPTVQLIDDDDDDDDEVFGDEDSIFPKKKKIRPMHQLAVKSLIQDDELVSETLADLLAWQGNSTKAIEMYRKLILQFPEKSSYFATKIEKISN